MAGKEYVSKELFTERTNHIIDRLDSIETKLSDMCNWRERILGAAKLVAIFGVVLGAVIGVLDKAGIL